MNTKINARLLSILLCFVMLIGLMPATAFAQGTKLETPQNLKLQGTVLSWDAVDNADYYSVHLYHPNYQYNIGVWQTDGTSFNLYKYLKDGETYGATVHACSNGSYQTSDPAEIPLTACTNAGVPIYNYVNVVNGTASATTAYPGMSVRLEAKPAPEGMVFDRWELSGGYFNITYHDTDTVVYVQAICDNDISARATYKYQENVTSAFTVQPQGGATLVGKSFDVTYAMNFTPQGTVKVQVEGNTPGEFTDLKAGTNDSASVKEDSVVTKTFRIMASDGTQNIYSDEFVVSWEDGPRFITQPVGGTVDHNVDFVATYALNFTPFSCRVERYNDYLGQWGELSFASATQATISSYDFNTSSTYRIKAIIEGGGEVYSNEFTVTWSDAVSKFIQQPVGGTVGLDEDFSFTFAINFTPDSNIMIQKYNSGFDSWNTVNYCTSLTSGTISGFASETTNKYRLEAYKNGTPIHSNEFTVTWEGTNYTVSFAANGGSGTMADVNNVSGEYTLPACGFTAPNGQRFKAWLVGGVEKAVGDKITVSANTVVTAIWENIPKYTVSYQANGGSGTMTGDMVEENGKFTLEACTFTAPSGKQFKAWAIGSANGEQKQPGDQITITGDTYIYAIWEDIFHAHDLTLVPAKDATCTEAGNKAYYTCSGCDKWFEDAMGTVEIIDKSSVVIPATGHTPSAAVKENEVAATCETDGSYDEVIYCSACGAELSREQKTVPALGHDWGEWVQTKAPTETENGSETRTCQRDPSHTETRDIPALGHTHNLTLVPAKAATCTEAGNTAYYICSGCGKLFADATGTVEINTEDTVVAALGHDYGAWTVTTPATCTADGVETRVCSHDASHKETRAVPATGHTPGAAVKENEVAATCETDGSYDEVIYCSVCGEELSREQKTVPALGHDWGDWVQTKAPTETEKGEETRTCKNDPSHTETREIPELGHTHNLTLVPAKAPTETEDGNKAYYTCSGCDKWFEDAAGTVEITDHSSVIIPATGTTPVTVSYSFTSGDGQSWTKDSGKTADFTVKRSEDDNQTFSLFTGIEIDGKTVSANKYTATAGSVNISLKADYLNTLSTSEHTIKVLFNDSSAEGKFTVKAASTDPTEDKKDESKTDTTNSGKDTSPKTGDESSLWLWVALLIVSGGSLFSFAAFGRKKGKYSK